MKKLHKLKSNVNNKVVLQRIQVAESYICSYKYIKIQFVDKTNHGNKVKVHVLQTHFAGFIKAQ